METLLGSGVAALYWRLLMSACAVWAQRHTKFKTKWAGGAYTSGLGLGRGTRGTQPFPFFQGLQENEGQTVPGPSPLTYSALPF